jgi:hypothetical protein
MKLRLVSALLVLLAFLITPTPQSTGALQAYELVCRGGGELYFNYTPFSNFSPDPQIWISFERGQEGIGDQWQPQELDPGYCTWIDRGVSNREPERLIITSDVEDTHLEHFSISWTEGEVMGISSALVYINALQREDEFQSFWVINDRDGNFIVTELGRSTYNPY